MDPATLSVVPVRGEVLEEGGAGSSREKVVGSGDGVEAEGGAAGAGAAAGEGDCSVSHEGVSPSMVRVLPSNDIYI